MCVIVGFVRQRPREGARRLWPRFRARARGFGRSSVFDQVTVERVARTFCLLSRDGQHHLDAGAAGEVSVGFCDATL